MEKSDFCVHLINRLDELESFIRENSSLFYDGITEDNFKKIVGNHYFPPHTAQALCVGNVHLMLLSVKNLVSALHENVLFDYKF